MAAKMRNAYDLLILVGAPLGAGGALGAPPPRPTG